MLICQAYFVQELADGDRFKDRLNGAYNLQPMHGGRSAWALIHQVVADIDDAASQIVLIVD